jgi:oligo-1,6-glucosidase
VVYGRYDLILAEHEAIYAFTRTLEDDLLLVILNFSAGTPAFELPPPLEPAGAELLISNYPVAHGDDLRQLALRPYEARVYRLKRPPPA